MTTVQANSLPTATPGRPAGTRRTVVVVTTAVACLIGLALVLGGGALVFYDRTQRDSGYVMSDGEDYATQTYAFTTRSLDVPYIGSGGFARGVLGKVRITSDSAGPVFLGIARAADVDAYLGSVKRAVLSDSYESRDASERGAGSPASPPTEQRFWATSVSGAGERSLNWKLRDGDWVAVLMTTDGSRGVAARLRIGAEFPNLGWIGAGMFAVGIALLAAGGFSLLRSSRRA